METLSNTQESEPTADDVLRLDDGDDEEDDDENDEEEINIVGKIEDTDLSSSVPTVAVDENNQENEPPYVPPTEEIQKRLVAQAEFYFSDENISKDTFLLKHIRKDKEGYVSLKLIASFRRLQRISKNWRDLAYAVTELSDKLVLNEKKTKVKRKAPLPEWDKSSYDRTVVAINFQSLCEVTVENVKKHFLKCGEVALVRILNPGKKVPHDLQSFVRHHPELASHVCVLIEFRNLEGAKNAMKEFSGKDDWRGLQVLPLKKIIKVPSITTTTASSGDESSPKDIPSRRIPKTKVNWSDFGGESSGSEARSATNSPKFDRKVHKKGAVASVARPIPVPGRVKRNDGTPGASPEVVSEIFAY